MSIKKPMRLDQLLFNVGKHLFITQQYLTSWTKAWQAKGNIIEDNEEIIELGYSKERVGQESK